MLTNASPLPTEAIYTLGCILLPLDAVAPVFLLISFYEWLGIAAPTRKQRTTLSHDRLSGIGGIIAIAFPRRLYPFWPKANNNTSKA